MKSAASISIMEPRFPDVGDSWVATSSPIGLLIRAPETAPPHLAVIALALRERPTFRELADMLLSSGEDAGTGPGARSIAAGVGLVHVRPGHAPPVEDAGGTGPRWPARGRAEAPRTSAVVFALSGRATSRGEHLPLVSDARVPRGGAPRGSSARRVDRDRLTP